VITRHPRPATFAQPFCAFMKVSGSLESIDNSFTSCAPPKLVALRPGNFCAIYYFGFLLDVSLKAFQRPTRHMARPARHDKICFEAALSLAS
jgi:hypothetical protein